MSENQGYTARSCVGATIVDGFVISRGAGWTAEAPSSDDVVAAFHAGYARAIYEHTIYARSFDWPFGELIRRIPWVRNAVRRMAVAEVAR